MNKAGIAGALSALALAFSATLSAEPGKLVAGSGVNMTSGDYGASTTTRMLTIPFDLGYETGAWTFKFELPYVVISGPANVLPGIGRVGNSQLNVRGGAGAVPAAATSGSARGLGDMVASAGYTIYQDAAAQLGIDVSGKIKFGTADETKGLGTGRNDYGTEVDIYKKVNRVTWFGGLGYTRLGSSRFIALNNVFNLAAGASLKLTDISSFGLMVDYRQRVADTSAPRCEATAFHTYRYMKVWKTQLYVLKGFANGSPDWGAGARAIYTF